jgi:hypothetical protein
MGCAKPHALHLPVVRTCGRRGSQGNDTLQIANSARCDFSGTKPKGSVQYLTSPRCHPARKRRTHDFRSTMIGWKIVGGPPARTMTSGDGMVREPLAPQHSALHADDLAKGVNHFDEIGLCGHDGVDVLVGHRRFVDHAGVLAALDVGGGGDVLLKREALLRGRA